MLRFAFDENFNNDVLRGLLRRIPALDFVRVQDREVFQASDPVVLAWAATQCRVVVTHDVSTLTRFAYERVQRGEPMPGVIQVPRSVPVRRAIEDLQLLAECGAASDLEGGVLFLPLGG